MMWFGRPVPTCLAFAALLLATAAPSGSQAPARSDQAPARSDQAPARSNQAPARSDDFADTSEVVAVEVPVNVVGRDGKPVRGLTAADFEIWDEGQKQAISGFEVVDLDVLTPADNAVPVPGAAPVRDLSQEPLDSTARRHFLLFFDLSFSNPTAVLRARVAAREFLIKALHPADLAAVATFSLEQGPRLILTFTPDRAQLARAIDTLGARHLSDRLGPTDPLRFLIVTPSLDATGGTSGGEEGESGLRELRATAEQQLLEHLKAISVETEKSERAYDRSRIRAATRSLGDMAKSLDSIKGRKHMIYFSEGFNDRLVLGRSLEGEEAQQEQLDIHQNRLWRVDNDNRFGNTELQGAVEDMIEQFRRADCVIQAVDIGGLRAAGEAGDQTRGSGQNTLFMLADGTGGELFKDANNLGVQLERVLERTDVTYLLTFQRGDLKRDGAYRKLRVKADLPAGARLSHRAGYYVPRPFRDLHPLEKSLLASDGIASAAPRRDLDLQVLAAPFRAQSNLAYVPVIIEIGGRSLLAGHTGDKLNVELYAYVSNDRGEMKDFFSQVVAVDLAKARQAVLATGVKYYGHIDLPPGQYRVRVLARNAETGRTGVESIALKVAPYDSVQPVLLPPLFLEAPGSWLLVRERVGEGQQASVVYPFTLNGEPYVPAARPELSPEADARLCLVAYNLPKGEVTFDGEVLGSDGQPMPGGRLAVVERTTTGIDGLDKLVATFRPTGLKAGDYVLRVAVTDPVTGSRNTNSVPFVVN
jgi:VWFA-related protein